MQPLCYARWLVLLALVTGAGCSQEASETSLVSIDTTTVLRADSLFTIYIDVAATDSGAVFLSATPPFLSWMDTSGRVTWQVGDAGRGPGLLTGPTAVETAMGTAHVWDPSQGTVVSFSPAGPTAEIRFGTQLGNISRAARTNLYGRPGLLRRIASGWVVAGYGAPVSQHREQRALAIVRIDLTGRVIDTAWSRPPQPGSSHSGSAVELLPIPVWDACPDGRIAVYDPETHNVQVVPSSGTPTTITVAPDSTPIDHPSLLGNTRLQTRRLLLAAHQEPPPSFETVVAEATTQSEAQGLYPKAFSGFTALICDSRNRIWLEAFSLADSPLGYGRTWRRFDGNRELPPVRLPRAFRLMRTSSTRGYGIVLDSAAAEYPAWIALPPD